MSVFDLHVHTVKGSSDSSLSPEDLVREALRLGLDGVCLTEHSGWRDLQEFKAFAARQELLVVHALEVDTVYGHVLAFGVDAYGSGFSNVRELRRAVHRVGGYLVTGPRVPQHLQPAALQPEHRLLGPQRLPQDHGRGPDASPLPPGGRR